MAQTRVHNPRNGGRISLNACASNFAAPSYDAFFHNVVDRHYRPLRHAAKLLARDTGSTPKTAERWLARLDAARGEHLMRMIARNEAVAVDFQRAIEELREQLRK